MPKVASSDLLLVALMDLSPALAFLHPPSTHPTKLSKIALNSAMV